VGRAVLLMGLVSLLTDLSAEMVTAILPLYLIGELGFSALQYGFVDGFYQGVTALVRVVGGLTADLTRRPKLVAAVGYALSAACKLALLPAKGFLALSAAVSADRLGKGLRTAPRDAIIAASASPRSYGLAFGVHRALDTVGAMAGPLVAFAVLAVLPRGYHALFLLSFSIAVIGVALLLLAVPNVRPGHAARVRASLAHADQSGHAGHAEGSRHAAKAGLPCVACKGSCVGGHAPLSRGPVGLRAAARTSVRLLGRAEMVRLVSAAGLLSLATIGDGFVYLALRAQAGISATLFPLLYVGTNVVFLALAMPLGRLADRWRRQWIFLGGHLLAGVAYLLLLAPLPGPVLVVAVLGLLGAYYAATDGVLSALGSQLLGVSVRATGLSVVQTVVAVGRLLAAVGFGAIWEASGQQRSVLVYGLAMLAVVVVAQRLLAGVASAGPRAGEWAATDGRAATDGPPAPDAPAATGAAG
jgi:MFS family permease